MKKLWYRLFLEERSSISLSLFRMAVAATTGLHVGPSLCHLGDNYYGTAFKTFNYNFFTPAVIELVQQSPEWLIVGFVWIFILSCLMLFVGFLSQFSCIVMTLSCYYFYALNAFAVGTLSWDILLVTLFLMCITSYHGDYFSLDCLFRKDVNAYRIKRPYFLQRLLQLQIAFTFFYTALYKTTAQGNWLTSNPIYYLMNYPPPSVTKLFILKDYLMNKPELCYWIGIAMVIVEFSMLFLLFWRKTRMAAIYLVILFQIMLILTLDVPAIFFFLFPPQILLFINSKRIIAWIDQKRTINASVKRSQLIYDGQCQFCMNSVHKLKIMDLYNTVEYVDLHKVPNLSSIHKDLTREKAMSEFCLVEPTGSLFGGFEAIRRLALSLPMLYICVPIFYFPLMNYLGCFLYRIIAKNRYLLHFNKACHNNSCFRKPH